MKRKEKSGNWDLISLPHGSSYRCLHIHFLAKILFFYHSGSGDI